MSKNFELLQRTNSEQELFQTPDALPRLVSAAGSKLRLAQGKVFQKRVLKSSGLRWLNFIKEGARSWERQVQERNNDRPSDLEALAREETIKLVQSVFSAVDHGAPQAVLFAGVEGEAGCASICVRASEILAAQSEGPVCVVDANFRSPSLHGYFGIDNSKGLAEAVLNSGPIQEFAQRLPESNLWVMPSGLAAAGMSFPQVSGRLQSRMTELRTEFRHVVIHSSPFIGGADSVLLSRWTDGVVLVVEADSTRRETARRVKGTLEVANVGVLGVVMNNRTFPIPEAVYRRL
jgi:Mrp family chromosome partitioning ATPase